MIKPRNNLINPIEEMKNINTRIIIFSSGANIIYFLLINNLLYSFIVEEINTLCPGNVYTGIVKKFDKASGGYFVSVSEKQTVYIPSTQLHDVHICSERTYDGKLNEGEQIIVQIRKSAYKEKRAQASCKIILNDLNSDEMNDFIEKGKHQCKYTVLYDADSYLQQCVLKYKDDIKVVCADIESYSIAKNQLKRFYNNIMIEKIVSLYDNKQLTISALYSLKSKLDDCTSTKVWLKNGGYIFINPTEAMFVIDVNSGKTTGKKDLDESALDTNLEAIDVILYHIQCRNLSGIIIIDFINQKKTESNIILIEKLKNGLKELTPPGVFVDMTKLGLVEITRKKIRGDIYENISRFDKTILL